MIPRNLVPKLSRLHKIRTRSFSCWSHVVALIHCQLSHSISLNDVSDYLKNYEGSLKTIRGATPPSRNGLSHASRTRNADLPEELFWTVLNHFQSISRGFGFERNYKGLPRRFKRTIYAVDDGNTFGGSHCVAFIDWVFKIEVKGFIAASNLCFCFY